MYKLAAADCNGDGTAIDASKSPAWWIASEEFGNKSAHEAVQRGWTGLRRKHKKLQPRLTRKQSKEAPQPAVVFASKFDPSCKWFELKN